MRRGNTRNQRKHAMMHKDMCGSKNRVDISRVDDIVFVQVVNHGNAMVAVNTRDIIEVHINDGAKHVVFDLAKCCGLDSTFMGMMVGFANLIIENAEKQNGNSDKKAPIVISNADETIDNQLSLLGLNSIPKLIHIKDEYIQFPDIEFYKIYEQPLDKNKRLNAIMDAHIALMKINEMNQRTFKPFLTAIVSELKDVRE